MTRKYYEEHNLSEPGDDVEILYYLFPIKVTDEPDEEGDNAK